MGPTTTPTVSSASGASFISLRRYPLKPCLATGAMDTFVLVCIISCMPREDLLKTFRSGTAHVDIYASNEALGSAAAGLSARLIADATKERGLARVIAATGNSQISLVEALVKQPVDWSAVELFHMDEYAGMPSSHPASFRDRKSTRLN